MVDRQARDKLAESLRHLVSGRITNDEFEERAFCASRDRGVRVVQFQAWQLYSDFHEHRLTGKLRVSRADRRVAARMIVFLHSGQEYQWPTYWLGGLIGLLVCVVTLGSVTRIAWRRWIRSGDFEVWPFITKAAFEAAERRPRLLAGVGAEQTHAPRGAMQ